MSETRWLVRKGPLGFAAAEALRASGFGLTLSVPTDDEDVVKAVEDAARRNGMVIERLPPTPSVTPPVYPAT